MKLNECKTSGCKLQEWTYSIGYCYICESKLDLSKEIKINNFEILRDIIFELRLYTKRIERQKDISKGLSLNRQSQDSIFWARRGNYKKYLYYKSLFQKLYPLRHK